MSKRLIKETIIYGVGAVLPRLINFLLIKVFASENGIPTDEFSIYTQLYASVSIINVLIQFGFETTFFRFSTKTGEKSKTFNTAFWFIATNALAFLGIILLFENSIASLLNYTENPEYLIWFGVIILFDSLCVMPYALLRFENKPIKFSIIRISNAVVFTLLNIVFFFVVSKETMESYGFDRKVSYPFISNLIASILTFLLLGKELFKVRFQFDKELLKPMFNYAYPIMFAGLAFAINENLDKVIMRQFLTEEIAGAYGGCYKLAVLMTLFVTAFRMGVEPYFFKKAADKDAKKTYAEILQYFVIVAGFSAIFIIANLPWLKDVFIGNDNYFIAINIVPIIVIANLFFGIYTNLSVWYKVTDTTIYGMKISWIGAGITLLFNIILMRYIGFMAAAWGTLIAYGTMMTISYLWGKKRYKIPYKRNKILFYLFLCIAFICLIYLVFNGQIILGNLFLILYIAIAYWIEKSSLKLRTND